MYALLYNAENPKDSFYVLINTETRYHSGWNKTIQKAIKSYMYNRTEINKLPMGLKVEEMIYPILAQADTLEELQTLALLKGH